tara:strand:- start:278 stop:1291 length:1014 start_codon:yes stop_codon:yes gene_type:complete
METPIALKAKANEYIQALYSGRASHDFMTHVNEVLADYTPLSKRDRDQSNQAVDSYLGLVEFKTILTNTANNILVDKWSSSTETWRLWVKQLELNDFRVTPISASGVVQEPRNVSEGAEYKHRAMYGEATAAQLKTYGDLIGVPRETIVNDNIGGMDTFLGGITNSYDRSIGDKIYSFLTDNPVSFEGKELFHADHNNVVTKTATLSDDLGAAMAQMYGQKFVINSENVESLRVQPKYLLVAPILALEASKAAGELNESLTEGQKLTVLIEPRLTGFAGWFLASDNSFSSIAMLTLKGARSPQLMMKSLSLRNGSEAKYRYDYDVTPIDYRGLVRVM